MVMAAELSSLETNPVKPVIVYDELAGMSLLGKAARVLAEKCVNGITANAARDREMVKNSLGLVSALAPRLGYEKSVAIAKESLKTGRSVYDLVLEKGWMTKDALDDWLKPENMTQPRAWPKKP